MTIACEDSFYVLRFSREAYVEAVQNGQVDDDGVEAAFDIITDIAETYVTIAFAPVQVANMHV